MSDQQRANFDAWYDTHDPRTPQSPFDRALACKAWQAAIASPEVQGLREALQAMLEVHGVTQAYAEKHIYIPQSWVEVSDLARAALAAMEKQK